MAAVNRRTQHTKFLEWFIGWLMIGWVTDFNAEAWFQRLRAGKLSLDLGVRAYRPQDLLALQFSDYGVTHQKPALVVPNLSICSPQQLLDSLVRSNHPHCTIQKSP